MSWIEQYKTQMIIKTGDGFEHKPLWLNAKKKIDFNIAKFEFPRVRGSLVYRGEPKGTEYSIELYFQGNDHLIDAKQFQTSSYDKRPWTVQHPFYGQLKVQPISLEFDNTDLNISKVTGVIIETISQDYPVGQRRPEDTITVNAIQTSQLFATSAANNTIITKVPPANVTAKAVNKQKLQLSKFKLSVLKLVTGQADAQKYTNSFNQAFGSVNGIVSNASSVLNLTQTVINQPALFGQSVKSRFTMLGDQFNTLRASITGSMSNLDKLLYTTDQGSNVAAFCLAAGNPLVTDFIYATDTLDAITLILGNYNQYIADLDLLQTINGGSVDSFMPDADSLLSLAELINFTLSNLFNIAVNGQQQRSIILEADSNWILLTHRLYGLDLADENLIKLMQQNNAGLNSYLQVRKNTKVFYYI